MNNNGFQHRVYDSRGSSMIITKTESKGPDMNITYSNKSFNQCKRYNSSINNSKSGLADKISAELLKEFHNKK